MTTSTTRITIEKCSNCEDLEFTMTADELADAEGYAECALCATSRYPEVKVIFGVDCLDDKDVGDKVFCIAGAPGVGHVIYKITHIDKIAGWVYGYEIENTMRVLDPSEVI